MTFIRMNPDKKAVEISFIGDIALNDDYVKTYRNGENPFLNIQPMLTASDFVIGNLECMAKGEQGENLLKKPRLTTTVETLNYLKTLNIKIVSLAHNHVYDHLDDGFIKTTNFLNSNNIRFLGASLNKELYDKPIVISQNNIQIGLLNYVTQDTNPNPPKNTQILVNIFNVDKAIEDIKALKGKVDHIVLLLHWGGRVEGGLFPDWDQPQLAHKLIDAGADLIIGHHSHTLQPYEIYKGKYIFYSLGNFCFSDYWFNGKFFPNPKRRMLTAIIKIKFSKSKYYIEKCFFKNKKTHFSQNDSYNKKFKLRTWFFLNVLKYKTAWKVYYFNNKHFVPLGLFLQRNDLTFRQKIYLLLKSFKRKLL